MKNIIKSELVLEVSKGLKNSSGFQKKVVHHKHKIIQTDIKICDDSVAKKIDREIGNYITLNFDDLLFFDIYSKQHLTKLIEQAIRQILKENKISPKKVLVVGLGNENYACESLGKRVVDGILVTKPYLDKSLFDSSQMKQIYAVALGVYGSTGLESSDTIKSLCLQVKPDLVVAVDSLIASEHKTLAKSIQICDTKLSPGGGVGNYRKEISESILNTKVLAIGVPLVLNISHLFDGASELIVTPKDVEEKVKQLSKIISKGINLAFTNISKKEYDELTC